MVLRAQPLPMLELCAGYGGFSLALRGIARTVCFVERDSYAAATLVARMESAQLDQAPIWSDLCTFDAEPWRGRVDIVTAGFPCQPFSAAGKRAGTDDDRWLWPDICRIIGDVRPRFVFLENVPGVVRHGLPHVLAGLAALGFNAEWGLLSAAAVGAPHKRERFWLVAHAQGAGRPGGQRDAVTAERPTERAWATEGSGSPVAYAEGVGGSPLVGAGHGGADTDGGGHRSRPTAAVADAAGKRRVSGYGPAARHWRAESAPGCDGHRFPPRPDDTDGWAEWIDHGGPEPSVCRGVDGITEWLADALHLGGNGLVPQCARAAWMQLTERGGWS